MRPPNILSQKEWQRFFAGVAIGAIISWVIYVYLHGMMQETQMKEIIEQQQIIKKLEDEIAIWEKESESINEETEKKLTIQEIQIAIENYRDYDLDLLSVLKAQEEIRKDLSSLITKDLETIYKGRFLRKKTVENKIIEINDKKYSFTVSELMFYTTIYIEVKVRRI